MAEWSFCLGMFVHPYFVEGLSPAGVTIYENQKEQFQARFELTTLRLAIAVLVGASC